MTRAPGRLPAGPVLCDRKASTIGCDRRSRHAGLRSVRSRCQKFFSAVSNSRGCVRHDCRGRVHVRVETGAGAQLQPEGETGMRFIILVKATRESEEGVMPEEKLIAAIATYHEELVK